MADEKRHDSSRDVKTLDDSIMVSGAARPSPAAPASPSPSPLPTGPFALAHARTVRRDPEVPTDPIPDEPEPQSTRDEPPPSPEEQRRVAEENARDEQEHAALRVDSTFNVALLGGKQVGKSYLFQSMVYRTHGRGAGALSCHLARNQTWLYKRRHFEEPGRRGTEPFRIVNKKVFITEYEHWKRLGTTERTGQAWYRLHLPYRTGLLGRGRSEMQVCFFDGSGDHLQGPIEAQDPLLWKEAFVDARVLLLCLPMWAAFPNKAKLDETTWFQYQPDDPNRPDDGDLTKAVWEERESMLRDFHKIVHNYGQARRMQGAGHRVQVIVALTQADSPLCDPRVRDAWIMPYVSNPPRYLRQLQSGRGVTQYLASAQQVSRHLAAICEHSQEKGVSDLLNLDYGRGVPWFVPVTAIEGEELDKFDPRYGNNDAASIARRKARRRRRTEPPVPAHVELPLLIALSEQHNALA